MSSDGHQDYWYPLEPAAEERLKLIIGRINSDNSGKKLLPRASQTLDLKMPV